MHFVPYEQLGDTPNIIVDGMGNAASDITLSHWPKSGTPAELKADSSAEIVFRYLASAEHHVAARAISNNHFDEDGLLGIYTLLNPDAACALEDLIVAVAHAGDFSTYKIRDAARVSFTISAFTDPDRSPLDADIFAAPYAEQCARLYQELLPRLGDMLTATENYRSHWAREDAALDESEAALRSGLITIEEHAAVNLATVRFAGDLPNVRPFAWSSAGPCHPMAINNATGCNRILVQRGLQYAFAYRYESWVQYMSAPPPPRVDLGPFAEALNADEQGGQKWTFEGASQIIPRMLMGVGESSIAPDEFEGRLVAFLADAPAAWDPFDA
jgi:hypothetical protein